MCEQLTAAADAATLCSHGHTRAPMVTGPAPWPPLAMCATSTHPHPPTPHHWRGCARAHTRAQHVPHHASGTFSRASGLRSSSAYLCPLTPARRVTRSRTLVQADCRRPPAAPSVGTPAHYTVFACCSWQLHTRGRGRHGWFTHPRPTTTTARPTRGRSSHNHRRHRCSPYPRPLIT